MMLPKTRLPPTKHLPMMLPKTRLPPTKRNRTPDHVGAVG
jgi:hypothetical protein